ncbi:hypothetical protein J2Z83_002693 [Virgibacillus natechei]|uniref:SCP2 domain-containing protein n=1 Tax=Virgibacillus natechei TaxID=1216297 RepID=A0ABS4IHZ3_9BACI|nr:hypothetical protein [Virgibacillus natechei]MBP1970572.1 hypothetical protein [Virgibacillus natechei]UZD14029.1 hypothetical protein OLD84_05795 [Virgibacillus natechei]
MDDIVSISALKTLLEKKTKKKILVKIMWNGNDKLTLFITPNMKINSFIFDEKEGYIFYDNEGIPVKHDIPCVLSHKELMEGKVKLDGNVKINGERLSKEDIQFLEEIE